MQKYTIRDIINYRNLNWDVSEDFFYFTDIPNAFESFLHKPNYFAYGLLEKGNIHIEIDGKKHNIDKNSFLVYRPEQIIRVIEIEPETKGAFILFTKKFLEYLNENIFSVSNSSFLNHQFESHILLKTNDHKQLELLFSKIFDLITDIPSGRWENIARNLTSVLIYETDEMLKGYLISNDENQLSQAKTELINKFNSLVSDKYKSERNLEYYASILNISTAYLHKLVKKHTGNTPASIINSKLLNEAKALLAYSNMNITEIAFQLSFSGIQSFSKYFKKQLGISPSNYRIIKIQ